LLLYHLGEGVVCCRYADRCWLYDVGCRILPSIVSGGWEVVSQCWCREEETSEEEDAY
jgi:hypothetical protein